MLIKGEKPRNTVWACFGTKDTHIAPSPFPGNKTILGVLLPGFLLGKTTPSSCVSSGGCPDSHPSPGQRIGTSLLVWFETRDDCRVLIVVG